MRVCGLAAEAKERVLRQFVPRDVRDDANLFFVFEVSHAVWKPAGKGKNVGKRALRLRSSPRNER